MESPRLATQLNRSLRTPGQILTYFSTINSLANFGNCLSKPYKQVLGRSNGEADWFDPLGIDKRGIFPKKGEPPIRFLTSPHWSPDATTVSFVARHRVRKGKHGNCPSVRRGPTRSAPKLRRCRRGHRLPHPCARLIHPEALASGPPARRGTPAQRRRPLPPSRPAAE